MPKAIDCIDWVRTCVIGVLEPQFQISTPLLMLAISSFDYVCETAYMWKKASTGKLQDCYSFPWLCLSSDKDFEER